jgi:hypothetical protein
MLAVECMADALPAAPPVGLFAEHRRCCVTGKDTSDAIPASALFSDTFGDFDILTASTGWVDRRVADVLGNGHLRWSSWTWSARDGWAKVGRADIARIALGDHPPLPWAAYAAEDMRRHGGLLTRVNTDTNSAVIQFGRRAANVLRPAEVVERARAMLELGFRRGDLDGEPESHRLMKLDIAAWMDWSRWREPIKGSAAFDLGLFCAGALAKEERDAGQADDPS